MIPTQNDVTVSGNMQFSKTVRLKLDEAAAGFVLQSLIDLYSQPYESTLRELVSNAWDSRYLSGNPAPVEVILPSPLNPCLVVQDYGVGLSRDELEEVYQFGTSTKRTTNDLIGSRGLGSKSPLAMAASFTVRAVKDGKLNTVILGRDETNYPAINFMDESDTTEPNGVKVTVPTSEFSKFKEAVDDHMFLGWEPGSILIDNDPVPVSITDTSIFSPVDDAGWIMPRDNASVIQEDSNYGGRALVGPVLYRIKWSEFAEDDLGYNTRRKFLPYVVVNLPIGSVDLTPSREGLIYSKRTRQAIIDQVEKIVDAAAEVYRQQIDSVPSAREAYDLQQRATEAGFEGANFTWKGQDLEYGDFDLSALSDSIYTRAHVLLPNRKYRSESRLERTSGPLGGNLSNLRSWVLYRRHAEKPLLVAEAGEVETMSARHRKLHKVARLARYYLNARHEADPTFDVNASREIFFVSEKLSDFPEIFIDLFEVVDVNTFRNTAVAYQREQARALRSTSAPVKRDRKDDLTTSISLYDYKPGGQSRVNTHTLGDLREEYIKEKKFILIPSGTGFATDLDVRAKKTLTTDKWQKEYGASHWVGLLSTLHQHNYVFIHQTTSSRVPIFRKILKSVQTLSEASTSLLDEILNTVPEDELLAYRDAKIGRWELNWTMFFKDEVLAKNEIHSADTREWIGFVNAARRATTNPYDEIRALSNWRREVLQVDPPAILRADAKTTKGRLADRIARYPLLRSGSVSGSDLGAIVEYLNFRDSVLDKKARKH